MKYFMILALITGSLLTSTIQAAGCHNEECVFDSKSISTQGIYVGAIGGGFIPNDGKQIRPGYYVGGIAGYKFSNGIRAEGEISYSRANIKKHYARKGHYDNWSYMANALYDFDLNLPFTPYVGAGLGYTHRQITGKSYFHHSKFHAKNNSFAWQAIAGVKTEIAKGLELGVDYRFVTFEKFSKGREHCHKVGLVLTQAF